VLVNPYGREPVQFLCDLTNRPLAGVADLAARCGAVEMPFETEPDDDDLAQLRAFLTDWTSVVDAPDHPTRVARLNDLLARWTSHPTVTDHADSGWHLHYRPDGARPAAVLCAVGAMGTALHLTERGMHRLGRCAATGCTAVFADVSRPGRQRYCCHACANRDAVRRHRVAQHVGGWDLVSRGSARHDHRSRSNPD
jgi:hypothetical protein